MFTYQIITLFPERFEAYFSTGIPKRAVEKKIINYKLVQLLDFAIVKNKKKKIDDKPYGGGVGMILRIEPIYNALSSLEQKYPVIAMTPSGITMNQKFLRALFKKTQEKQISGFTFISGYYEGMDQRILDHLVDLEISIGDYILNSGDIPILCFIDAFSRFLPDYIHKEMSLKHESFEETVIHDDGKEDFLIEYPQYTKPRKFKDWEVPEILLKGNHKLIEKWRLEKSLEKTKKRRNLLDI